VFWGSHYSPSAGSWVRAARTRRSYSRVRFDVRYYLVAIIFIVFDLEIAFFFPWAVSLGVTGTFGLLAMLIFALVLVVALVYDYRKGALEWD
jgi:NADH-quinone oxidoreductase subunit A